MRAVVLLSGGLDSAVNLGKAVSSGQVILGLTFAYGQRAAAREANASAQLAAHFGVPHRVIALPFLGDITRTSLVNVEANIPEAGLEELEQDRLASTARVWVPNRNGLFINIAASFAEALEGDTVVAGFNREEGAAFPDNSPDFVAAANVALGYSTLSRVRVKCFTQEMDKADIVRLGRELGVPLTLTWSCYYGGEVPCGRCESCRRVKRAWEMVAG
ncbi:MAG: 7-cyano-7-deazaguanine synthase QueC [Clostridia bacterium]|nr:MAG: 7-cyano-7-deazaguanine synthase QueC [Clostridia bacterium]